MHILKHWKHPAHCKWRQCSLYNYNKQTPHYSCISFISHTVYNQRFQNESYLLKRKRKRQEPHWWVSRAVYYYKAYTTHTVHTQCLKHAGCTNALQTHQFFISSLGKININNINKYKWISRSSDYMKFS